MKKKEAVSSKEVHVGEMIRAFLNLHRLSKAAFARHVGIDQAQVQAYLGQKAPKTSVVFAFSHAYQHNFFADLAATLPPHYLHAQPDTSLQERIAELEAQLKQVTAERDVLKEVIGGK